MSNPQTLRPPNGTNASKSCSHKWIHLDTNKSYHFNDAACRREYYQTDRFYCENCCEIKEISKML
jgi:hypothetical protein